MAPVKSDKGDSDNGSFARKMPHDLYSFAYSLLTQFGLATFLLLVLIWWGAPRVDRVLQAYESNITAQSEYLKKTEGILQEMSDCQQRQTVSLLSLERSAATMPEFARERERIQNEMIELLRKIATQSKTGT